MILDKRPGIPLTIHTDYNGIGKIQYILSQDKIPILRSEYTDSVLLEALVPVSLLKAITSSITESTSGQALLKAGAPCLYALSDGKTLLFEEEVI